MLVTNYNKSWAFNILADIWVLRTNFGENKKIRGIIWKYNSCFFV